MHQSSVLQLRYHRTHTESPGASSPPKLPVRRRSSTSGIGARALASHDHMTNAHDNRTPSSAAPNDAHRRRLRTRPVSTLIVDAALRNGDTAAAFWHNAPQREMHNAAGRCTRRQETDLCREVNVARGVDKVDQELTSFGVLGHLVVRNLILRIPMRRTKMDAPGEMKTRHEGIRDTHNTQPTTRSVRKKNRLQHR